MAKLKRKKSARRTRGNSVNQMSEPPIVLRKAADVATLQGRVARDRIGVAEAERGVLKAKGKLENARAQLTTDMLNHQVAVGEMEKASRLQMPVG
jgi:hypothetical protein